MKILTKWLRSYLPAIPATDAELAEALTLRGIAVDGSFDLGDGNGTLLEMDITTNRVDAMNHYGVAREAAAIYALRLPALSFPLPKAKPGVGYPVRIEAKDLCGRFTARVLRGVTIGDTDGVIADYFRLLEQKCISNAVDATNYAWLAMGHPTHAFDLDKIEGAIVVRRAIKGERLKTLDEIERVLDADDLVVADEKKALALAGVMGGWDTRITAETKNVLVEAAWFDPATVRRSSRRHGLHTDASHRFERGADLAAAPLANDIVSSIILSKGGEIVGELTDVLIPAAEARTTKRAKVALAVSEVRRILGTTLDPEGITAATVETVLRALGCTVTATGKDAYEVTLPSWRLDLEREIDLIEEVARVYGYNRFADTLPAFAGEVKKLPHAAAEQTVQQTLRSLGVHEAISSTFCSAAEAELFAPGTAVPMGNPLSEEAGVLRPSLLPGMLAMVAGNLNRDVENIRLFELGTTFRGTTERVSEQPALSLGLAGSVGQTGPHQAPRAIDFYDAKGIFESVLDRFETQSLSFVAGDAPAWLHPYRAAQVLANGEMVGWFGELHPAEAKRRKLKQTVFVGELCLDRLYKLPLRQLAIREISRYQAVRRDFSLVLPDAVAWSAVEAAIRALAIPELIAAEPKEIFRDTRLLVGEYSLLLATVFQSAERTLEEAELKSFAERVIAAMELLGGRLRS
jgi:phenylalanyl-tRNA synthetase beta chain